MRVTFLETTDMIWADKNGRHKKRQLIMAGTTLHLQAKRQGDDWELWNGRWSILISADAVQVEKARSKP